MLVSPPLQPSLATARDPAGLPVAPRVALADLGRDCQSPIFSPKRPEKCQKNRLKLDKMDTVPPKSPKVSGTKNGSTVPYKAVLGVRLYR